MSEIEEHDGLKQRCRRLGHEVPFGYCRQPGQELPCGKIADCWFERFDVEAWLKEHFTAEQIEQIIAGPKDKRLSIVELIQQAQKHMSDE